MPAAQIVDAIKDNPDWAVFVNVLLQQLGLPVPAVPTLMVAGSLAMSPTGLVEMVGVAVLASVVADLLWYQAGRIFGYRVLSGLCRLSINPGSCVSETEARFVRSKAGTTGCDAILMGSASRFRPGSVTCIHGSGGGQR